VEWGCVLRLLGAPVKSHCVYPQVYIAVIRVFTHVHIDFAMKSFVFALGIYFRGHEGRGGGSRIFKRGG